MTSAKKNISLLADIFVKHGLTNIVISPGSRNAPIILSFANRSDINAFSIVDERSAAFFALGLALNSKKTTAIACTSGSAALNYSSAISEAYYQKIPLLIITADRPEKLIDVGDGQTIRQKDIFSNFIKESYQLPLNINSEKEYRDTEEIINEAINNCIFPQPGPVHINIPFDEPIYETIEKPISGRLIQFENKPATISRSGLHKIITSCSNGKVMIIAGQSAINDRVNSILMKISQHQNTIVLTETTSNINGFACIDTIDNVISTVDKNEAELFKPDIIISFGGQVVSKMIKKFLRENKPKYHWHISPSGDIMDTYFSLTDTIKSDEYEFLKSLFEKLESVSSNYFQLWHNRKNEVDKKKETFLSNAEYSDLKVFDTILKNIPKNSVLHLGNSTPVRYSQLFGCMETIVYNSNRGVSGIDGHISTASGYAYASDKLNVLITGDLGFFYDSNGLMNKYLKSNLKIIVINNSGGGIFRFIQGPDETQHLEKFFEAKHNWSAEYICKAFDVEYLKSETIEYLDNILPDFLLNRNGPALLEIFTPSEQNGIILREYFEFLRK